MRYLTVAVLGLLVGCSGAPDSEPNQDSGGGSPGTTYSLPDNPGGSGSGGPCDSAGEVIKVTIDGQEHYIEAPVMCNPYWRDTGDPPPDRQRQQVVDPDPWEAHIQARPAPQER
jgi:hypothetical protein